MFLFVGHGLVGGTVGGPFDPGEGLFILPVFVANAGEVKGRPRAHEVFDGHLRGLFQEEARLPQTVFSLRVKRKDQVVGDQAQRIAALGEGALFQVFIERMHVEAKGRHIGQRRGDAIVRKLRQIFLDLKDPVRVQGLVLRKRPAARRFKHLLEKEIVVVLHAGEALSLGGVTVAQAHGGADHGAVVGKV